MLRLVALLLVIALQGAAAIQCSTSGTTGETNNLIRSVIVDFEAPISAAVIEGGTKVNLTLYHRDPSLDAFDSQTDLIVNVAFESLVATRVLRVGGIVQSTGELCNTTDQMAPVHMGTIISVASGAGTVSVQFSEPVRPCFSAFSISNLTTLVRISAGVTELTPHGASRVTYGVSRLQ